MRLWPMAAGLRGSTGAEGERAMGLGPLVSLLAVVSTNELACPLRLGVGEVRPSGYRS